VTDGATSRRIRVLVEHSGYDLLNVGDVAMLRADVERVTKAWPEATLDIVAHDAARLATYIPGASPVGPQWSQLPALRWAPPRVRTGFEQASKTVLPLLPALRGLKSRTSPSQSRRSIRRAVKDADVVIATGGGYICDTFWRHGAGVLSALDLAQRLGKPTAMFGQGIGPLENVALRRLAARVLGRLDVLGLREARLGPDLLIKMGVIELGPTSGLPTPNRRGGLIAVTGDSALSIAARTPRVNSQGKPRAARADQPGMIGVNLRATSYSGVADTVPSAFQQTLWRLAEEWGTDLLALPVSRYASAADLPAIRRTFGEGPAGCRAKLLGGDLSDPSALAVAVGSCRVVVTGSYHAAVFALARGIPAVTISASSYYDAKFFGLADLFPDASYVVRLDAASLAVDLESAIRSAWNLDSSRRETTQQAAMKQIAASEALFAQFVERVENRRVMHGLAAVRAS
jgi:polysaccharide pyruvyl transferase WcaK-like protein